MNKKTSLFLLHFFLVIIVSAQNYYWSNNSKIPISEDEDKFLLKVEEGSPEELSITKETSNILTIKRINRSSILLEFKENSDREKLLKFTKNRINSFKNTSGSNIVPTGEVLFKPKKGHDFKDINRFTKGALKLVQEKYGCITAIVKDYRDLILVSNTIYESGLVDYSHPNFIDEIIRNQNDLLYPDQYYLNNTGQFGGTAGVDINAPQAWAITTGLTDIRVAVIDDGVENHVDIDGRVVQGYTSTNSTGFGAPAFNSIAHGQACAGIIGASRNNNNEGIAGIAPCVDIVPVNIFAGNPSTGQVANSIDWAWDEGNADVLSNSWSYGGASTYYDNIAFAIGRARSQGRGGKGSVVVFFIWKLSS